MGHHFECLAVGHVVAFEPDLPAPIAECSSSRLGVGVGNERVTRSELHERCLAVAGGQIEWYVGKGWKPTTHGPDAGVAGPARLAGKGERQVAALGEAADDASFERYAGCFGLGINKPAQRGRGLVEACLVEAVLVDVEPRCAIAVWQVVWCSGADGGEPGGVPSAV